MPNTPAMVNAGAAAISYNQYVTKDEQEKVKNIFSTFSEVVIVDEKLMDAVTGLSGSGPAYAYMFIDSLADGGVKNGLPRDIALKLAAQTVFGAAKMVLETGEHPGVLRDMVTSPGGTTIAGLSALKEGGFNSAGIRSVEMAAKRSEELGK